MARPRTPLPVRFWQKVERPGECWLWKGAKTQYGYGLVGSGGMHGGLKYAHRIAYELTIGPIPEGMHVLHRCDNPSCVNPAHLFLGTLADNAKDMYAKGRGADRDGEKGPSAKLTWEIVTEIRRRYAADATTYRQLGAEFGVVSSQIGHIIRGEQWKQG